VNASCLPASLAPAQRDATATSSASANYARFFWGTTLLQSYRSLRSICVSIYGLALGLLCTGFPASVSAAPDDHKYATVPFTYVDNRMMIDCMINGQGPFVMIVDTGDPVISITPETAKRLAVTVREAGTATGAGNKSVKTGSTTLGTLSIGALSFKNADAEVIDLTEIRTKLHFAHLDGIIGYPILKQFATFVNVDDGEISFGTTRPAIPTNATNSTFTGVLPVIAARIEGITTTVLVDAGDRSSLTLFTPFAKQHTFYVRYPSNRNIITGFGIGGPIYADVFTLPSLEVLGTRITGVVTRASRQTGGAFAGTDQGGSIGTGILKRFNIVYDYPHHTIIAWPSKFFKTPDHFVPPGSSGVTDRPLNHSLGMKLAHQRMSPERS
jgi:hypothetical protein